MFYKYGLRILLFAVMMLFYATSVAVPTPALNLPALTKESSLIVVGRIVSVRDAGEGVLSLKGLSIPVLKKIGKIQVIRILKGQHSDPTITVEFVQTIIWYGIKDVGMERQGMFFLKSNG